jgi:hypothetical protein
MRRSVSVIVIGSGAALAMQGAVARAASSQPVCHAEGLMYLQYVYPGSRVVTGGIWDGDWSAEATCIDGLGMISQHQAFFNVRVYEPVCGTLAFSGALEWWDGQGTSGGGVAVRGETEGISASIGQMWVDPTPGEFNWGNFQTGSVGQTNVGTVVVRAASPTTYEYRDGVPDAVRDAGCSDWLYTARSASTQSWNRPRLDVTLDFQLPPRA